MKNLLLEKVEYQIEESSFGVWRRFMFPNGRIFAEFRSHSTLCGLPLVHITRGPCPETGARIVAIGIVAIGRVAVGVLAVGQASLGLIAIGQLALGVVFGLGQAATGCVAVGQLAIGAALALGQFAVGAVAVGQIAAGFYVLAQKGFGLHVWDMHGAAPAAKEFFQFWKR